MQSISDSRHKVIHIHSDVKFIGLSKVFSNRLFDNCPIFLHSENKSFPSLPDITYQYLINRPIHIRLIVEQCRTSDIVVVYGLDLLKAYIINQLPKNIFIVWRLFGAELYSKLPKLVYSPKTLALLKNSDRLFRKTRQLKHLPRFVQRKLLFPSMTNSAFDRAINRINYFSGISLHEYNLLKHYWPNLPPFIQWPYSGDLCADYVYPQKSNTIIIGNSRNAYNNHLDILELIRGRLPLNNYRFDVLFSYGQTGPYQNAVAQYVKTIPNANLICNFMDTSTFVKYYSSALAFVLNGYRQLAVGNILLAFKNSVKVYLNDKNITKSWLLSQGFRIFSTSNLSDDLLNSNMSLDPDDDHINRTALNMLYQTYNVSSFNKTLMQITANRAR